MPLRVDRTQQTPSSREVFAASNQGNIDFNQTLNRTQKLKSNQLQEFLDHLDQQGKKLSESFSLRDLADFRDMVKSFLRSTFGQSRQLQEDSTWDFSGRPKVMARITRIDHALEDLGRRLIDEQAKPLDILDKIDEIRGLIVDLFA